MPRASDDLGVPAGSSAGPGHFLSTAWSMILQAQKKDKETSRRYLGLLIQRYWRPVYFFVRHFVGDHEEAKDITQGFFASFLEKDAILYADRGRGRFRNFLAASAKRYMQQRHRAARARPDEVSIVDFGSAAHMRSFSGPQGEDPASIFMKNWVKSLVETCLTRLREECRSLGKEAQFEVFRARFLHGGAAPASYGDIALRLGISEKDVDNCFGRAKRRFARIFRGEVRNSVGEGEQVDDEIRELLGVLAS
jgi:RNA polymerase sigma-70 factor (ECF subfamily)